MTNEWSSLKAECEGCRACPLCETRTNVVFGVGDTGAELMFIGEGPGEREDLKGEPFVGRAGMLLDQYLLAVGLSRQTVYIANIVKCRPPKNRDPLPEEQQACIGYLHRQIALIKPKVIMCLGRIAAKVFIDPDFKVTVQHGEWVCRDGIWITGTFHPAALLRNPNQKPDAFADFTAARDKLLERA